MGSHVIVVYPIGAIKKESSREQLFEMTIQTCTPLASSMTLIYNERSRTDQNTKEILKRFKGDVMHTWGVDTCQDWLTGWGHVLDNRVKDESKDRVVLLPGDLDEIHDEDEFFSNLPGFVSDGRHALLVGDFDSVNPRSPKELIDMYGVYPLVANWFPHAWQQITHIGIKKPRSEFLNIRAKDLRTLLGRRPFAYEQTLNMLILKWTMCSNQAEGNAAEAQRLWEKDVGVLALGRLADDSSSRSFRGAVDQLERTERMLRMLWREVNDWNPGGGVRAFRELIREYEQLDQRSTRIRDAAWIAMWSQLGYYRKQ